MVRSANEAVAVGRISRRRNPPSFGGKKDGGLRCANPPYGLARLPRCAHARVRGLTADNGRQMFDKPLACGAQSMVGEVGAAHHELGNSRVELHGLNDL